SRPLQEALFDSYISACLCFCFFHGRNHGKAVTTPAVLRHNQWLCLDLHLVRALRSLLEQDMVQVL
ncbi:MAG: hypothetical protein ACPIOQ_58590, partial [Promethearchaeia archaeon]